MPRITVLFALALIVLGVGSYAGTGGVSITALIPAVFGLALLIAGLVARSVGLRHHAMHAAAMVALLGALGSVRGLLPFVSWTLGREVERPGAAAAQTLMLMLILCVAFVGLCINSFVSARKRRAQQAG
jgi:hypothetical protein